MVSLSNNTQGNVNITTKNGKGVNLTSNNDTDVNANMNGNAQRAKSWAVGEGLIDGVDYSAKYYAGKAKESEEIAERSIQSEDNAHIWAEGTDEEVEALGGEHSSKGWVDYVIENAPTAEIEQTETGATITVTDIHGTTTADILNGAKGDKGDTGAQGEQGIQGAKGDKGDTGKEGNGIDKITKTSTSGLVDTYSIYFTTPGYTPKTFTVTNGKDGTNGTNGQDGAAATISLGTVSTGAAGSDVIITNSGTSSAAVFNFTIPKGDKGDTGNTGATGQTGATGNGISGISKTSTSGLVDTYTISYTNGNSDNFTVTNGEDGTDGQDGYSPSASVSQSGSVTTIDITDKNGTTTASIDLSDYATQQWAQQQSGLLYQAMQQWVGQQGYALSSSLATVATSGSYNDLSNKPTIPDAQVQADWDVTDTTSKAYIKNKPYIPSGVVVDQTYDGTSTNAQSGVAIAGAGFATETWAQQQSGLLFTAMQQWVQNQGYTTNVGTVTSVNNTSPDANGNVTLSIPTNYVQATNGNTAYTNTGTETTMGYTDTSTYEMYGVIAGKNTTYGTGIILGAQNGGSGYLSTLTTSGLTLMNATNPPSIQTAILTVSNNNLAVNGNEVQTQLVSGTNIKTINNTSILGSGNIDTSEIFIAEYGITTLNELNEAYNAGKEIFCYYQTILCSPYGFSGGGTSSAGYGFSGITGNQSIILSFTSSGGWSVSTRDLTNTDLSNLSATGKTVIDGQWVDANEGIISSNTSLSGSSALTKRITLPDDNHKYEVLIRGSIYTSSTSGKEVFLKVKGNEDSYDRYIARCITRTSSAMYASGSTIVTASYVANNQTNLTIARDSSWSGNCSELTVVAYRRIGTNT